MERPGFECELTQPMLRMIRSARSRLNRDHSAEGVPAPLQGVGEVSVSLEAAAAVATQSALVRWRSDLKPGQAEANEQQSSNRSGKTEGTTHCFAGVAGRHRLTRSRSSLDLAVAAKCGSENVAPASSSQGPTADTMGAVLRDVTNTSGGADQLPSHFDLSVVCPKLDGVNSMRESGSATASTVATAMDSITELASVAAVVSAPPTHELIGTDLAHAEDPQHVVEYVPDIYRYLHCEEAQHLPQPGYMDRQAHVNAKMRAILVDWLVDVHKKYKLRPETLFLAISLVDRYLDRRLIARRKLQLVGVTALLVAAKFEEMHPPEIQEFVYVTDKAYTNHEVVMMEASILNTLDFRVCRPTAVSFLERYVRVNGCHEAHHHLVSYLLELTLVEYKMIKYSPSHLAAAAVLLSNKLLRRQPAWTPAAVKQTKLTEPNLKECAKEICALFEHADQNPLQAVRKKFSQRKYNEVAKLNFAVLPKYPVTTGETQARGRVSTSALARSSSTSSTPMAHEGGAAGTLTTPMEM